VDAGDWPVAANTAGMLLLFGGSNSSAPVTGPGANSSLLGDVWQYDLATDTWAQLQPSGQPPPAMANAQAAVASGQAMFWGGVSASGGVPDIWVLELLTAGPRWRRVPFMGVSPPPEGPGRAAMAALADPPMALMLRTSGGCPAAAGPSPCSLCPRACRALGSLPVPLLVATPASRRAC
jgi:hypothetical protein